MVGEVISLIGPTPLGGRDKPLSSTELFFRSGKGTRSLTELKLPGLSFEGAVQVSIEDED